MAERSKERVITYPKSTKVSALESMVGVFYWISQGPWSGLDTILLQVDFNPLYLLTNSPNPCGTLQFLFQYEHAPVLIFRVSIRNNILLSDLDSIRGIWPSRVMCFTELLQSCGSGGMTPPLHSSVNERFISLKGYVVEVTSAPLNIKKIKFETPRYIPTHMHPVSRVRSAKGGSLPVMLCSTSLSRSAPLINN